MMPRGINFFSASEGGTRWDGVAEKVHFILTGNRLHTDFIILAVCIFQEFVLGVLFFTKDDVLIPLNGEQPVI